MDPSARVPFGRQQLLAALQAWSSGLQMTPGMLQTLPFEQRPNSWVGTPLAQVTVFGLPLTLSIFGEPDHPQQSLSFLQISPVGAQPDAGWQIRKPWAAPLPAQILVQHSPPHDGTGSSASPQTVPFGEQFGVPPAGARLQVPRTAPGALPQTPPQHSKSCEQASPIWKQNDGAPSQIPFVHAFEQQSPFAPHGLPEVLQESLSGTHFPSAPQVAPQHWPSTVQSSPSAVHWSAEHFPSTQA
jgi:hypothetical protein